MNTQIINGKTYRANYLTQGRIILTPIEEKNKEGAWKNTVSGEIYVVGRFGDKCLAVNTAGTVWTDYPCFADNIWGDRKKDFTYLGSFDDVFIAKKEIHDCIHKAVNTWEAVTMIKNML